MASSAPLTTTPCPITSPRPLAPPVTTQTLPLSENVGSVGARPALRAASAMGEDDGTASSAGYSTVMELSVRACVPLLFFPFELGVLCCEARRGLEWMRARWRGAFVDGEMLRRILRVGVTVRANIEDDMVPVVSRLF